MKKTLVALAALAATGAFAQSTVTLYGVIDAGVRYDDNNSTFSVRSGQFNGSRWGMKGTEDLGGGLNAVFQLEGGFSVDTGALGQGGLGFGRQAYAGVGGSFGTVTIGRQYTPGDNAFGWDPMGATGAAAGPMYAVFTNGGSNVDNKGNGRQDNSINYALPTMGGLNGNVMYAPDEGAGGQKYVGAQLAYTAGPLLVSGAYENQTAAGASKSDTGWVAGASYDLGVATVGGGLSRGSSADAVSKDFASWYLGASAPLGAAKIAAGYAKQTISQTGFADATSSAWGINAWYTISKRTNLYGGLMAKEDVSNAAVTTKNTIYVAGLRHQF